MEIIRPSPLQSTVDVPTYGKKDIRAALMAHNAPTQTTSHGHRAAALARNRARAMGFRKRPANGLSPLSMNSDNSVSVTASSPQTLFGRSSITPLKTIGSDSPYTTMSQQLLPTKEDLPLISKSATPFQEKPLSWKGSMTNPKVSVKMY